MTSTVSKALRNIVAERDSYTCVLCENGYTDMHHVTPRSQGGRNTPYNLVSLCRQCHSLLHRELPLPANLKSEFLNLDQWIEEAEYRFAEYLGDYYAEDLGCTEEAYREALNPHGPVTVLSAMDFKPVPRQVLAKLEAPLPEGSYHPRGTPDFDYVELVEELALGSYMAVHRGTRYYCRYNMSENMYILFNKFVTV